MREEAAIRLQGLCKSYGERLVVDHLSMEIPKGCLFSLLGVNGAGKTTTLRMLSGLLKPDAGDAVMLGFSIMKHLPEIKTFLGVSPQETAVAPNLTVEENLRLMARLTAAGEHVTERVEECIDSLSLDAVRKQYAKRLSGGYQRRLSIAMALIGRPQILFLDEPTLGLDVLSRHELWELLKQMKGRVTILLTTHYLEEAEALSDLVGIMQNGRLRAMGTAQELCANSGKQSFEEAFLWYVQEGMK